jgi:hypothetical protein
MRIDNRGREIGDILLKMQAELISMAKNISRVQTDIHRIATLVYGPATGSDAD